MGAERGDILATHPFSFKIICEPRYGTDFIDIKWQAIDPLLPKDKSVGKLRKVNLREVKKTHILQKLTLPVINHARMYFILASEFGGGFLPSYCIKRHLDFKVHVALSPFGTHERLLSWC